MDDAVVWSLPRADAIRALRERPLMLMLHGYGSNEHDLFGLANYLPSEFVVASIRGLIPAGAGFAWFPLDWDAQTGELRRDNAHADAACQRLYDWLNQLDVEVGVDVDVTLFGFSQGGAMLLHLMRHAPHRFRAAVVLSGFALPDVAGAYREADAALAAAAVPVFWGRDPHDPVITSDLISYTRRWLPEHSDLDARLYANMGHGVSVEEMDDVCQFLNSVLSTGE